MQTWAKRGLQTTLATGGVLMLGTGIASASKNGAIDPMAEFGLADASPGIEEAESLSNMYPIPGQANGPSAWRALSGDLIEQFGPQAPLFRVPVDVVGRAVDSGYHNAVPEPQDADFGPPDSIDSLLRVDQVPSLVQVLMAPNPMRYRPTGGFPTQLMPAIAAEPQYAPPPPGPHKFAPRHAMAPTDTGRSGPPTAPIRQPPQMATPVKQPIPAQARYDPDLADTLPGAHRADRSSLATTYPMSAPGPIGGESGYAPMRGELPIVGEPAGASTRFGASRHALPELPPVPVPMPPSGALAPQFVPADPAQQLMAELRGLIEQVKGDSGSYRPMDLTTPQAPDMATVRRLVERNAANRPTR
jgi:hypothetical protein